MRPRRILIIEDEPLLALHLETLLADAGFEMVDTAGTIEAALAIVAEAEIAAALLDANLSGRSAEPVASALALRGIPFIFVTGYGRESLPSQYQNVTMMTKPVDDRLLIRAIQRLIEPDQS